MPLAPGTKLGPYEIVSPLGAGGMGEVYLARDTKLGRNVALKVLPEGFTQDRQRMVRFEREAKLLASFNHPNIASIYGLEDSTSVRALVLELVEGPALADRIKQGAVPIEEALQIAKQIAEALEYAHERNIVHRDLKPANIKLTSKDEVKVLDFGLAKAIEDDASSIDISTSPTISHMATQAGIILGTAAYMSPEQAKGKSVDRRADIWAFACVFLEMLTGKIVFSGETVTDTLAAVVLKEPDWSQLPTSTPDAIRSLLQRCLKKDQRQRLQAIGDARIAIDEVLSGTAKQERVQDLQSRSRSQWLSIVPWSLLIIAAVAFAWFRFSATTTTTLTPTLTAVLVTGADIQDPIISPDGRAVAYEHDGKLWLRNMTELDPRPLEGTDDAANPFWSPDSRFIGYFHNAELRRISAQGGPSNPICQITPGRLSQLATWGADDRIVFEDTRSGLLEVSAQGGTPRLFTKPDPAKDELILRNPHFLADGKTLAMIVRRPGPGLQLDTVAIQAGSVRSAILQIPGARLNHVVNSEKTGHLLFVMNAPDPGVWAVPFSFSKLKTIGKPLLVRSNVRDLSVTSTGDLVYSTIPADNLQDLAWIDRSGKILSTFASRKDGIRRPEINPDGRQIAFESAGARWEIWVADSVRNTAIRLAGDFYSGWVPQWLAGGKSLWFDCQRSQSSDPGFCIGSADGNGTTQQILPRGPASSFSVPDQKPILIAKRNGSGNIDIWRVDLRGRTEPEPFLATQFNELEPRISPAGNYFAYQSDENGSYQIYVRPFPTGEGRWMISTNGGTMPKWSPRGDELFYLEGGTLMAVAVQVSSSFKPGIPRVLFSGKKVGSTLLTFDEPLYDVAPDGKRFVVVRNAKTDQQSSIVFEQGWFAKSH